MEEIKIRRMNLSDYDEVINLWRESGLKFEIDTIDSYDSVKKALSIMPRLYIVAVKGSQIIGTIIGSYDFRKGYLHRLVVKEEFRGQGIGSKLFHCAETELIKLGAKRIDTLIFKDNYISKNLLKKMNYEPAYNVTYFTKPITTGEKGVKDERA